MSRLPLLKLPYLALKEVLVCLDPIEIFTISQCSPNLAFPIGRDNFNINVIGDKYTDNSIITVNDYKFNPLDKNYSYFSRKTIAPYAAAGHISSRFGRELSTYKLGGEVQDGLHHETHVDIYWDNAHHGLLILAAHLSKLFNSQIETFNVPANFRKSLFPSTFSVKELRIDHSQPQGYIKWILNHVKVSKIFIINAQVDEKLVYSFPEGLEEFHARKATWLTFRTLESLNSCKWIFIFSSTLTNQNLDKFVQLWKSGKFPNLDYFTVEGVKEFSKDVKISGFTMEQLRNEATLKSKRIDNREMQSEIGQDIQGKDGSVARIYFSSDISFTMFVWRNGEEWDG